MHFRATDFGILGYAMLSARKVRFAIQIAEQYSMLLGGGTSLSTKVVIDGNVAYREWTSTITSERLRSFELEEAVAQFMVGRELVANPDDWKMTRATFEFAEPDYKETFTEAFNCPVEFGVAATRLYFPTSLLDLQISSANDLAREICEDQCRNLLRVLEERGGFTEKVRNTILKSPGEIPSLQDVAASLNLSVRTMRRRLKNENMTYKEILTGVRMHMAKKYLAESPLSIKEISYLLGYSEAANFQRAFRNWYDMTPGQMRMSEPSM